MEDSLSDLYDILADIIEDHKLFVLVHELDTIFSIFNRIREILGQTGKTGEDIKNEIEKFIDSLQSDPTLKEVYIILKKRFMMYENELYICYDNTFIPRTNNDLEDFNNRLKRPIRKGQGMRESWFYVEHQGEPAAMFHNLLNSPHVVGGADISWTSEQTPLERIGVLNKVSVSEIMALIDREWFYSCLMKNDEFYTVHRWTCRIFKHGLDSCLDSLQDGWLVEIHNILQGKIEKR